MNITATRTCPHPCRDVRRAFLRVFPEALVSIAPSPYGLDVLVIRSGNAGTGWERRQDLASTAASLGIDLDPHRIVGYIDVLTNREFDAAVRDRYEGFATLRRRLRKHLRFVIRRRERTDPLCP